MRGIKVKKTDFKDAKSLREVVKRVLIRDLSKIKNKRILEIGCGAWDFAKKILEKNSCEWHGLEPVDMGAQNLTIVKGSVKSLPCHNNSFDIVLCNQTMEHWFEYNVSLNRALNEINRVLNPGGVLMINSPIHLHGDPRFLIGELGKIKDEFSPNLWKIVLFEKCFPSQKIQGWKRIAAKGFFSRFGYPDFLIPHSKQARTYILNIHARKRGRLKSNRNCSNKLLRYFTVIMRFIKVYIKTRIPF